MIEARAVKVIMVGCLAVFALLVAFDDLTDYDTNYLFGQHVLSMDALKAGRLYRRINSPAVRQAGYAPIIAGEALTGAASTGAAIALLRRLRVDARCFNRARRFVLIGGASGFLLWFFGFRAVGGEWFQMWQSPNWNDQELAFRFYMTILTVLIFSQSARRKPRDASRRIVVRRWVGVVMMWSRREFGSTIGALACGPGLPDDPASAGLPSNALPLSERPLNLTAIPLSAHEEMMRQAIAAAKANPAFPFGAVIMRAADRRIIATGVNHTAASPILHGEIACLNDNVARHGNRGWGEAILYTTGEPCPMCIGALVWAGIGGVVYGTSIERLRQVGINQINIPAIQVIRAAPFYHGEILGGVLEAETDTLFINRERR